MAEAESGSGVLAFLKKIGLPGIIAAIVSAVVTMIPFLFQLDERYAKADVLDERLTIVAKQINELTTEVGKLAGTQQVLVSIMSAPGAVRFREANRQYVPPELPALPTTLPALPHPVAAAAVEAVRPPISIAIPQTAEARDKQLDAVSKSLERTQVRVLQIQQQIPSK